MIEYPAGKRASKSWGKITEDDHSELCRYRTPNAGRYSDTLNILGQYDNMTAHWAIRRVAGSTTDESRGLSVLIIFCHARNETVHVARPDLGKIDLGRDDLPYRSN